MLKVKEYSAIEVLRDGCRVEIRALRPDDTCLEHSHSPILVQADLDSPSKMWEVP